MSQKFRKLRSTILAEENILGVEAYRKRKDSSYMWIRISAAPLHDEEGNVAGIIAVNEDITQRKQME